jgi:sulfur carrier protein
MAEALQIQVNGLPRDCRSGSTVGDLLRELDIKTERVAVELNLEILDRKDFDLRSLNAGDRVEILSFIGGGGLVFGERDGKGTDRCMMIAW